MQTVITASRLIAAEEVIENPVVVVEDGVVTRIATRGEAALPEGEHVDFAGCTLAPGLFDVHIHGSVGHDIMEATPEAFGKIGSFLAARGVTSYLPTTVTAPLDTTLRSLEGLVKFMGSTEYGAKPLGIHLEGPFLSPHKKGAHAAHQLLEPTVTMFDRFWQAAEGHIRLMTIAPELPGALEVIEHATKLGVRISMGHSDANSEQAAKGTAAGAVSATHTYNAMRAFDHRSPGLLGEVLSNDHLYGELICDGLHVAPQAVKIYWKCKGPEKAILITDAMAATGMPDGNYKLGELDVRVKDGVCLIGENTLAGSTLTLDHAVRNFAAFTGAPLTEVAKLASRNPARMTGFADQVGTLAAGRSADMTVLNAKNEVVGTILRGQVRG
ncbi:N-acetylglucosamine-6-phosphate deacetylase [Silvibacterium dinghuense]|uniref:N-acetylglucosamine-6-phosphate deacetylase n=1 Tax=Silvibacterium dinghuense TaxID=1560006 RepID=A0A4Q1SIR8_9BACT|nr:N-acetylglucosamine-6-phosphate deacetylase [Silvibacterium dinghuense]RXS97303.1 N-acetylglucosamine-6-phosphate deacetylase [Silvibacterium dinghuense]GGG97917.1 N-acetylglucosamine-6-phosphate deacetylase [Silvibacterium dinghuense]